MMRTCISSHIYCLCGNVTTHPCPNLNGGLIKLGRITSHPLRGCIYGLISKPHVTKSRFSICLREACRVYSWWRDDMKTLSASMRTSSNGNIFVLLAFCEGIHLSPVRIHLTKAIDAEFWCFLWSAPEQTVETIETPVIWDAIALIMTPL